MPKIKRKLTEAEIKNAKPKEKDYKLYDEGGLYLLVRTAAKRRHFLSRELFFSKQRRRNAETPFRFFCMKKQRVERNPLLTVLNCL